MVDTSVFRGKLLDLDTHLCPGRDNYELAAGEVGKYFAEMTNQMIERSGKEEAAKISQMTGDESTIFNEETVWRLKGASAPGSFTNSGRLKVFDQMGVKRGFIFSDPGVQIAISANDPRALPTMHHWNDFILDFGSADPDRLRVATILNTLKSNVAIAEAKRVLKMGGRSFVISSAVAPDDQSPAAAGMDTFWGLMEESNSTVIVHAGEVDFLASPHWATNVAHLGFQPDDIASEGEQINTYSLASIHFPVVNLLTTMILGGVFERFPKLRFAAIELGGHWLGPLSAYLDQMADIYRDRLKGVLSLKPSEYIRRNVRVTPYRFEPLDAIIANFGLRECYCYSSDFPHPEGGTQPIKEFSDWIQPLGQSQAENFFVLNAQWVLPPLQ
jgi:predicted TIM-barrel fold metal-dependent hydrolase